MKKTAKLDPQLHIRKKVAGGATGAVLGAVVAGPMGALVGGVLGTVVGRAAENGLSANSKSKTGRNTTPNRKGVKDQIPKALTAVERTARKMVPKKRATSARHPVGTNASKRPVRAKAHKSGKA